MTMAMSEMRNESKGAESDYMSAPCETSQDNMYNLEHPAPTSNNPSPGTVRPGPIATRIILVVLTVSVLVLGAIVVWYIASGGHGSKTEPNALADAIVNMTRSVQDQANKLEMMSEQIQNLTAAGLVQANQHEAQINQLEERIQNLSAAAQAQIDLISRSSAPADGSQCVSYPCLIFEDEFDSLNFDNWQHEITAGGGGNWEFQYYTNNRTNSYVRDGTLYVKPTLTDDKYGDGFVTSGVLEIWGHTPASECTGNQWYGCLRAGNPDNLANVAQSARLRSVYGFNVRYGRIDVEARMPIGDWLWPAIWLLPTHEEYGGWPASGEIDIVESRGNLDLKNTLGEDEGHHHASAAMHWGPYFALNSYELTNAGRTNPAGFGSAFHKYSVEWNANEIIFYIDDVELMRADPGTNFWDYGDFANRAPGADNPWAAGDKMAPFDRPFYLIMNVAVGGTTGFFSDASTNVAYPKPWLNTSPTAPKEFWAARDMWYPTWNPTVNNGEDAALKVNSIRVYKMSPEDVSSAK